MGYEGLGSRMKPAREVQRASKNVVSRALGPAQGTEDEGTAQQEEEKETGDSAVKAALTTCR
ncbi:hypothetical protein C8034_v006481 [Colletotrichum sidae]|uniref:Uncharacterized protein n=2 Tax=Colletotrichum orbiculare species complex TaxID=2707354 RepID=A0A4R8PM00_9PEZI|nr:hypothetical protein C8035_v006713 [Colletotrichum spinosum]TEA22885.1 hypothetical protein C8034_v006481 [Colletotrichum sidae]